MERLIAEALEAEAAEAGFPSDAWERQQRLLVQEGLARGDGGGAPVRARSQGRTRNLLEILAVAAVLALLLGLGNWWREAPPQSVSSGGGDAPPAVTNGESVQVQVPAAPKTVIPGVLGRIPWAIHPEEVERLDPENPGGMPLSWDRQDPRLAPLAAKLVGWLSEAGVVQADVPADTAQETLASIYLQSGERIRFGYESACNRGTHAECPVLVSSDRRPTLLIAHPDLWRWLAGRMWYQEFDMGSFPARGPFRWTGPLKQTEAMIRELVIADPRVKELGLQIEVLEVQPRYTQRQEANGAWRIDEAPVWTVYLGPTDPTGIGGQIRIIDDQTSTVIWQVDTQVDRSPKK